MLVETARVKQLCTRITTALRAHLRDEKVAVARTDGTGRTRLLADLHVVLARLLGNQVLAEALEDPLSRSSLMYHSAHSAEES